MNHLATGMHAGIGAATTNHLYRMIGNTRQGFLYPRLQGIGVMHLRLPAAIATAIIFNTGGKTHGVQLQQEK
jgi:hypothetical protein